MNWIELVDFVSLWIGRCILTLGGLLLFAFLSFAIVDRIYRYLATDKVFLEWVFNYQKHKAHMKRMKEDKEDKESREKWERIMNQGGKEASQT